MISFNRYMCLWLSHRAAMGIYSTEIDQGGGEQILPSNGHVGPHPSSIEKGGGLATRIQHDVNEMPCKGFQISVDTSQPLNMKMVIKPTGSGPSFHQGVHTCKEKALYLFGMVGEGWGEGIGCGTVVYPLGIFGIYHI
eukprot:CAMPEP_0174303136 /NCGR_PEP_ID=MMETSP0809-20121228/60004_1 /TAXON_ID=73025 ORGANISM="Eutreptiella gymnastica-like, Strain CCMP1594" /NCGR_SAMPLE_ID=MMETSP0809 /ASSEMBLY_ACC=CAM_ASM_000658 /LENGTH=137 /DNA_ID=CAMNT_0015409103 /DNA_START=964 /DNA_END=1378 /DNA_ORIENTATION=+